MGDNGWEKIDNRGFILEMIRVSDLCRGSSLSPKTSDTTISVVCTKDRGKCYVIFKNNVGEVFESYLVLDDAPDWWSISDTNKINWEFHKKKLVLTEE